MSQSILEAPAFQTLSYGTNREDAESQLKLKDAAGEIERALAIEQAKNALIQDKPGVDVEPVDSGRETRSSRRAAATNKQDQGQSETSKPSSKIEATTDSKVSGRVPKRKKQDSDSESDHEEPSKKDCISKVATTNPYQTKGVFKCIGILPSMSNLVSSLSDSSDNSSDSSHEDYDFAPLLTRVGRKAKQGHHEG